MQRLEKVNKRLEQLEADKVKFLAKKDDLLSVDDLRKCEDEINSWHRVKRSLEIDLGIYRIAEPFEIPQTPQPEKPKEEVKPVNAEESLKIQEEKIKKSFEKMFKVINK